AHELEEVAAHLLVDLLEPCEQRVARLLVRDELLEAERDDVAIARAPQRRDLVDAALDRRAMRLAVLGNELRLRLGDCLRIDRLVLGARGRGRLGRRGRFGTRLRRLLLTAGSDEEGEPQSTHVARL